MGPAPRAQGQRGGHGGSDREAAAPIFSSRFRLSSQALCSLANFLPVLTSRVAVPIVRVFASWLVSHQTSLYVPFGLRPLKTG